MSLKTGFGVLTSCKWTVRQTYSSILELIFYQVICLFYFFCEVLVDKLIYIYFLFVAPILFIYD